MDARPLREEEGAALPRDREPVADAVRARVDDARPLDPVRPEVEPLLVETRFCVRAAAIGCDPWCDKADDVHGRILRPLPAS